MTAQFDDALRALGDQVLWAFIAAVCTGLTAGIIGFFILDRLCVTLLRRMSPRGRLWAAVAVVLGWPLPVLYFVFGLFSDHPLRHAVVFWPIALLSMLSMESIVVLFLMASAAWSLSSSSTDWADVAGEVLSPFVAGVVGFALGLYHKPDELWQPVWEEFFMLRYLLAVGTGIVSAGFAFGTKKLLGRILS